MNTYKVEFVSKCPINSDIIVYKLKIKTDGFIYAEHIHTATKLHATGLHENIADDLYKQFGGYQVLKAIHRNIKIKTERGQTK